ncbi:hypothetical protein E2K93_04760 [Thalassotalea sp. HSM 43]|uniref:hypothetical protein n=1 Tax=Thalassotalea sp. HSM 43 TaxID=2552945 RepID=UPI001080581C|nr:hypothetical protein [Thalassotalea sp. HSM 43]QBY03731.1 hypothetical protein E2K93_04760 [Thalassotalea sp. HSM 43]
MNRRLYLVSLWFLALPCTAYQDNYLEDIANKWECSFPVNPSGKEPTGNFYSCRDDGCNGEIYKFYQSPDSYLAIKNFVIDFKANSVSFEQAMITTLHYKDKSMPNEAFRKTKFELMPLTHIKLHEYDGNGDDHIVVPFISYEDPMTGSPFEAIKPKPNDHYLSQGYSYNTLTLFDGGIKILWQSSTPFNYKERGLYTKTAFGSCRPLVN